MSTLNRGKKNDDKDKKKNEFVGPVKLKADTSVFVTHNLNNKKLRVSAIKADGTRFPLKYKVIDNKKIRIDNRDTIEIKVTIKGQPKPEDQKWYKSLQYVTRFAMMLRNVSVTYRNTYAMSLPGFKPEVGDMLGQKKLDGIFSPGLDFAFGLTGNDYIDKAAQYGWLMRNDSVVTPATTNAMEDLQIRATVEPVRDLKIELNASRTMNSARSVQFMFDGMPETRSGNFQMTTISIASAFEKSKADNNYMSSSFKKFVENIDVMQRRVEAKYANAIYPAGSSLAGQKYDPANGSVSKYSSEVMIPAFLAAYTGKDARTSALDIFPSMLKMLPNWRVTYSGLSKLDWFKKHFKSFNLTHGYKSIYSVGSYNTFQSFMSFMGDMGFIEDIQTGNPVPSSMYDISTVSINEQFSPLIGVDMTFHNSISTKVEYKSTRVLTLSMAANQVVENLSNDFVVGFGYTITGLKTGKKKAISNNSGKSSSKSSTTTNANYGNDIDLRADFSWRNQIAYCRNIQDLSTQATQGTRAIKMSFSADYELSRMLTLRFYYDFQKNIPLVSSTSYPVTTSDIGISLRFSLTR